MHYSKIGGKPKLFRRQLDAQAKLKMIEYQGVATRASQPSSIRRKSSTSSAKLLS